MKREMNVRKVFSAVFGALILSVAPPALAEEHETAHHEGHGETTREATHEGGHEGGHHGAGFYGEVGAAVANGYERFGAIVTDQTATTGFVGLGYRLDGGYHVGFHGLIASTSKEQFEKEASLHVGWHGDRAHASAAYNSVNHTNHDLTTTEAQLAAGFGVTDHMSVEFLANLELDHEKRSFYEAGIAYTRPVADGVDFRFAAMAGYLRTDGIAASHDADAGHETDGGTTTHLTAEPTADAGHETAADASFAGLHRASIEAAVDYTPAFPHSLKITGFVRAITPLSNDGKRDMEARSFDGKSSATTLVGLQAALAF
jgi:hypothetical protein